MKPICSYFLASAGVLLIALAIYLFFRNEAIDMNKIPTLKLTLGQNIFVILRDNHYDHDISRHDDNTPVIIESPVQLDFAEPNIGFKLPPTRYLWLTQYAGIVTSLSTSPQLEYWNLEKAHEFATQMMNKLVKLGWVVHREYPLSYEEVRDMFDKSKAKNEKFWKDYGDYSSGDITLNIDIKQIILPETGNNLTEKDAILLLNIHINNEELSKRQGKITYGQRRKVNGTANDPLPLSYWHNAP